MDYEEAEKILEEDRQRRAAKADELRKQERIKQAEHALECAKYELAEEETLANPRVPKRFVCKIGFHGKPRWDPSWTKGTLGFCTDCGACVGAGIHSW